MRIKNNNGTKEPGTERTNKTTNESKYAGTFSSNYTASGFLPTRRARGEGVRWTTPCASAQAPKLQNKYAHQQHTANPDDVCFPGLHEGCPAVLQNPSSSSPWAWFFRPRPPPSPPSSSAPAPWRREPFSFPAGERFTTSEKKDEINRCGVRNNPTSASTSLYLDGMLDSGARKKTGTYVCRAFVGPISISSQLHMLRELIMFSDLLVFESHTTQKPTIGRFIPESCRCTSDIAGAP